MKKLLIFLTIIGIIVLASCTKVEENNDPIIGIWSKVDVQNTSASGKSTVRQEWIFNDAYLGRYHSYESQNLTILTDFEWTVSKNIYTISYPGTDIADVIVSMDELQETIVLTENTGEILAIKE